MPYCTDCGSVIEDGWRFCRSCGRPPAPGPVPSPPSYVPPDAAAAYPPPPGYPPPRVTSVTSGGLRTLSIVVEVALWVGAAGALIVAAFAVGSRADLAAFREGNGSMGAAFDAADRYEVAVGLWLVLYLAIAALFITWLYRTGALAERERRTGTWGKGWAIGSWFIPLANFVLPFLYTHELWRRTAPEDLDDRPDAWRRTSSGWCVWAWWIALSLATITFSVSFAQTDEETFIGDAAWVRECTIAIPAFAIYALAGVFGALLVRTLTRRLVRLADGPPAVVEDRLAR